MSSHIVDHDHDELENVGTASHDELELVLQGVVPTTLDFSLGIPLLPENNVFSGVNSFDTLNVNNLNVVTQNQVSVNSLAVDNSVIALGQGALDELPPADRALIFMDAGLNPTFFWDQDQSEFRFGRLDVDISTTDFPDPSATGQGGYANLRAGNVTVEDVTAQTLNINDISVYGVVSTPEIQVDSIKTTTGEDYLLSNISAGPGISITADESGSSSLVIKKVSRTKETAVINSRITKGQIISVPNITNITELDSSLIDVYVNGIMVLEGQNLDYLVSGEGIAFSFDLEENDVITLIIN